MSDFGRSKITGGIHEKDDSSNDVHSNENEKLAGEI